MTTFIWKVTAIRNNGNSLQKGMQVEIPIPNGTKPNQHQIADALNAKYNTGVHHSKCGLSNFEILRLG